MLESFGLGNVKSACRTPASSAACSRRPGSRPKSRRRYDRLLDGDLTVLDEIEARLPKLRAPLRLLFDVKGGAEEYLRGLRDAFGAAVPAIAGALDELVAVSATLDRLGCPHQSRPCSSATSSTTPAPSFEIRAAGCRIGTGGRYDELIGLVGGDSVPASGFALSVEDRLAP